MAFFKQYPGIAIGLVILFLLLFMAVFAPFITAKNPTALSPFERAQWPSAEHIFGTDNLGRDLYARVIYGARVSLIVGFACAFLSTVLGMLIGLFAGFYRILDAFIMRIVDGFMSIPAILLAIALITLTGASLWNVIISITIIETPRTVRLMRAVVLTLREQPYVEAASVAGASKFRIMIEHILPNTLAPMIVQATYVCAVAIIIEAGLSFIGAGVPPTVPSWGNIIAEGRTLWQLKPYIILFPALFLSVTVLGINLMGDALRDALDPRMTRSA